LDLYRGQYDFTNFSTQEHDFDPGINPYPGGLFWTVPTAPQEKINLGTGTARLQVSDLELTDFFNIPNALFRNNHDPVSVNAKCSFDVHWHGPVSSRGGVNTPGSSGELVMTQATMTWSASNTQGFSFVSDPSPTTSAFAQVGHVRNGVFA
jgi:hypothetical protein